MLYLHRCPRAFSNCGEQRILFVAMLALLIAVASRVAGRGLSARGLQESARGLRCCSSWALVRRLISCRLVLPWHVILSQTGDQTRVSSLGGWILNHSTTREVPPPLSLSCMVGLSDSSRDAGEFEQLGPRPSDHSSACWPFLGSVWRPTDPPFHPQKVGGTACQATESTSKSHFLTL